MVVKKKINRCPECSTDRVQVPALAAVVLQEVPCRLQYHCSSQPRKRAPIMNVASTWCRSKLGGHLLWLLVIAKNQLGNVVPPSVLSNRRFLETVSRSSIEDDGSLTIARGSSRERG
ncbi:hypothetical protein MRX96_047126 [Rhipicephalus microplus]